MTSLLQGMNYIGQQYESGRGRAKENALAKLYQQGYSAPQAERGGILAQMAGIDPQSAMAFDAHMQKREGVGVGNVLQSQKVGDDGYIYNSFRDGRMVNTGIKADRQMWFRDHEGMAPQLVGKDGSVVNVGQGPAPTPQQAPLPADVHIDPALPPQVQAQIRQSLASGYEPPQQMFFSGAPAQPPQNRPWTANTPNPYGNATPRPSAAQTAADVERAKQAAQLEALPTELGMRTQAEIAKTRGVEQAKSEQERAATARAKSAQLNNVDRGLSRIDTAMQRLSGRFVNTGPMDGFLMQATPEGQELERAVGAIQNDLLALTRVPGIGSQSDLEAKIANMKYPSIYNHPDVNKRNVEQLQAFMKDLRQQITGGDRAGAIQPGGIEGGYRFKGGDPADPSSWEKL